MDITDESEKALERHHDLMNELMKLEQNPIANRQKIESVGAELDELSKTAAFQNGLARAAE